MQKDGIFIYNNRCETFFKKENFSEKGNNTFIDKGNFYPLNTLFSQKNKFATNVTQDTCRVRNSYLWNQPKYSQKI